MVIGHSGCPAWLFLFIYLFHMPLFFFCSGIFYKDIKIKKDIYKYLKKRVLGLYFPFVKWSVLFLLLHNFFIVIGIYNPYYGYEGGSSFYNIPEMFEKLSLILFTMHGYEELLGGFWFIRALFIASLLIVIMSILLRKCFKYKQEVMFLLFLSLTILIRRWTPDNIDFFRDISMGTFGAMFYMLGNILMKYCRIWQNIYCTILCLVALSLFFFYFKDGISMACGFNKVVPFTFSAVWGTLFVISLSNFMEKKMSFMNHFFYYIGNHTLEILALHFLAFRFVSYFIVLFCGLDAVHVAEHPVINDIGSFWWVVYSIVGVGFPLLLNKVTLIFINKIKQKCKRI